MKKLFFLLLLTSFTISLFGEDEKKVNSEIKEVTVFRQGAQVSRTAVARVPSGISSLKFVGISPNIDRNSIQLKADGSFTIMSISPQTNYFEAPEKSSEIKKLESQKDDLQDKINVENAMLQVYKEEETLIINNRSIGGQNNGVQISELKATAEFYRSRMTEIKLKKLELEKTIKQDQEEFNKINQQLTELNAKLGSYTSEVLVKINAPASTEGRFNLSYIVKNAGWFPNYDVRVKDVQSPVELAYKANVFQTSGEDWNKVQLTLSTGNPNQSGTVPDLQPWYLNYYQPGYAGNYRGSYNPSVRRISGVITDTSGETLIGANVLISGTSVGTVTDLDGRYALDIPLGAKTVIVSYTGYEQMEMAIGSNQMNVVLQEGVMLDEVVITGYGAGPAKKRRGKRKNKTEYYIDGIAPSIPVPVETQERTTSVEFKINIPYTIKTDGKQTTVQIKEHSLPAYYEYYCAPKIDPDAFLTAQVTDWEDYDLLNGEMNLFFEGTFLGKSFLDVQNIEDTLNLSLGRDKNIVVKRTRLKEFTKKQFIGNKRTDSRAWEIEIRNKKKQAINLVVEDQFPISNNAEIEVNRKKPAEAELNEDTGIFTWKMKLASSETKNLEFRYEVKYPKKKRVVLE